MGGDTHYIVFAPESFLTFGKVNHQTDFFWEGRSLPPHPSFFVSTSSSPPQTDIFWEEKSSKHKPSITGGGGEEGTAVEL